MKKTPRGDHRQIWGNGFHAGVRAAEKGVSMNPNRFQALENGLTGVARKVLEATPQQEAWHPHIIGNEIKRVCGATVDKKTLLGCLASLVDQGLVRDCGNQTFRREVIREKPPHVKLVKDDPIQSPPKQPEKPMAEKNDDMLAMAGEIAASLRKTADKVEEFGLSCAKRISDKDKENGLVRQLKELLKD